MIFVPNEEDDCSRLSDQLYLASACLHLNFSDVRGKALQIGKFEEIDRRYQGLGH